MVVSAFNLSYGIGQLPAGWLADRIGPRFLITIGLVGVALTGLLIGLSQTFVMLLVFLVLMGMFGGGYHPAASPLIAASVEPEKRGRALGFHLIGGSSSFFLAPIIAAAIAAVWGWRGSFIVLAAPTIVFGMIFYVLLSRRKDVGRSESIATNHEILRSIPGQTRHLVAFMILTTSVQAVILSVIAFMPLFMVDQFGVSEGTAAASLAYVYVAGLWASPLGGYLSDRLGRVPVMLVINIHSFKSFNSDILTFSSAERFTLFNIKSSSTIRYLITCLTKPKKSSKLSVCENSNFSLSCKYSHLIVAQVTTPKLP